MLRRWFLQIEYATIYFHILRFTGYLSKFDEMESYTLVVFDCCDIIAQVETVFNKCNI